MRHEGATSRGLHRRVRRVPAGLSPALHVPRRCAARSIAPTIPNRLRAVIRSIDPTTGATLASTTSTTTPRSSRAWPGRPPGRGGSAAADRAASSAGSPRSCGAIATRSPGSPRTRWANRSPSRRPIEVRVVLRLVRGTLAAAGARKPVATDASSSLVRFDPLGAVMPWNFRTGRSRAAARRCGRQHAAAHTPRTPGCALYWRGFTKPARAPVPRAADPGAAAEALVDDPRMAAVTGGEPAAAGGHAPGGAQEAVNSVARTVRGAPTPTCRPRWPPRSRGSEQRRNASQPSASWSTPFAGRYVCAAHGAVRGRRPPRRSQRSRGPTRGRARPPGARLGGDGARRHRRYAPRRPRLLHAPTVLARVADAGVRRKTFGPLAAITVARDAAEALVPEPVGIRANVWTDPARRRSRRARGRLGVRERIVKSDPRLPFGVSVPAGRELSVFGIREFVNVKTAGCGDESGGPGAVAYDALHSRASSGRPVAARRPAAGSIGPGRAAPRISRRARRARAAPAAFQLHDLPARHASTVRPRRPPASRVRSATPKSAISTHRHRFDIAGRACASHCALRSSRR